VLTSWAHDAEREHGRASEGDWRRQASPTRQREGEESAWARKPPLTDGVHLSGGAGARGPAWMDWAGWAEMQFSNFPKFPIAFPFIFSNELNSNSNTNSNSNNSNM
jgi:hypothetical protein